MLHLVELHIADHENWGVTHYKDVVLPAKIKQIKSLFVSAQLGQRTFVIPTSFPNILFSEFISSPFKMQTLDALIGSLSISANNADIIMPNMNVYAQAKMKSSYKNNHFELEKPYNVRGGSTLRLTMEERAVSPFYNKNLWYYRSYTVKALMKWQGLDTALDVTNDYTIKLYIEYD